MQWAGGKIQKENILVVVDDIHIGFGRTRLRGHGSDGGHNGLKDIIQHIGRDFARLRIGIGSDFYQGGQSDYVLGKWSEDEREKLAGNGIIDHACDAILNFTRIGLSRTMSQFNN